MNMRKLLLGSLVLVGLAGCCLWPVFHARAAAGEAAAPAAAPVPTVVERGFAAWAKNRDASWAFDIWKMGGLMERDNKPITLTRYFARMDQSLGPYKSYEVVDTEHVSRNSAVIYLGVNFDHAVVFGRFMVYQTDKGWVVQDMDFSPKPEALMPWLAFEGGSYN
jgi:hypothetical protein